LSEASVFEAVPNRLNIEGASKEVCPEAREDVVVRNVDAGNFVFELIEIESFRIDIQIC
jgi:hypothetical protein